MPHQSRKRQRGIAIAVSGLILACFGVMITFAQEGGELGVNHAECSFLGPDREKYLKTGLWERRPGALTALTREVTAKLSGGPSTRTASHTGQTRNLDPKGTIDKYLFQAMEEAGVAPAAKITDLEFLRRATLDLTGRVPRPERLLAFLNDTSPDKRRVLVEELIGSDAFVDKWTMYFGDLLKNTQRNSQVNLYPNGRDAFHRWIRESVATNKPYSQMVTELITASGDNSHEQGELNWLLGGIVTGSPRGGHDIYDQMTANIAGTFLGISHMNCVLCHDGRRHLDTLSLWGGQAKRIEAWEMSAFLYKTAIRAVRTDDRRNRRYYRLQDQPRRPDYPLNTETGNRPPRFPEGEITNVSPRYPFSGKSPQPDDSYRQVLARELVADPQFARAAVNYLWKEFFGLAMVEPPDQFDPIRLDPDNPPPEPWTLQPNQPRLLNALAQDFIDSGFDIQDLMRQMVNSEAYQLSSRYQGEWNPEWEALYARKYVRRLWAEEIHDALVQTSGVPARYRVQGKTYNWAMQFPEPAFFPGANHRFRGFLDSFQRGDRDEEPRRSDGSAIQALHLMNDTFVVNRARALNLAGRPTLAARVLEYEDPQLVDALFLIVLSRFPTPEEKQTALASLQGGDRKRRVEDLQWALYNKVDFIFNY